MNKIEKSDPKIQKVDIMWITLWITFRGVFRKEVNNMHKDEVISKVAKKTKLSEYFVRKFLNLVLSEVSNGLKKGQRVTLTGFGTFVVRRKKRRMTHDINSNKKIIVPAHKAVSFIVGEPLKKLVK